MKKAFYFIVGIVVGLAVLLVGYGFFLNYTNEKNIALTLSTQRQSIEGVVAKKGTIHTSWECWPIRFYTQKQADVVTRNSGTIEEFYVTLNQHVTKDQPLALIKSEEVDLQIAELNANIAKATTAKELNFHTYNRYTKLRKTGAVSEEQYDQSKAEYEGSIAELKALKAQEQQLLLAKERLTLKAPFEGNVQVIYHRVGSYVSGNTPIIMVADFNKMLFYSDGINSAILRQLEPLDQTFGLTFDNYDFQNVFEKSYTPENIKYENSYVLKGEKEIFEARIINISPPLEQDASFRKLTFEVQNKKGILVPRTYLDADLFSRFEHTGVLVPLTSFDKTSGCVLVWNIETHSLEKRNVKTGYYSDTTGEIEILEGLTEGEYVASEYSEKYLNLKEVNMNVGE